MGDNKNFVKEITNIDEDFAQWYTDIVRKAELADYTDTKGCIAIRPYSSINTRKFITKRKRPCRRICTRSSMGNRSWWRKTR